MPTQLAALLGYTIERLRITDEVPPRISVIDLATAITQKDANHAAQDVAHVRSAIQKSPGFWVTSNSADRGRKRRPWQTSYRRLFVVPGHEGCEGPDRARLRPDMEMWLKPEANPLIFKKCTFYQSFSNISKFNPFVNEIHPRTFSVSGKIAPARNATLNHMSLPTTGFPSVPNVLRCLGIVFCSTL